MKPTTKRKKRERKQPAARGERRRYYTEQKETEGTIRDVTKKVAHNRNTDKQRPSPSYIPFILSLQLHFVARVTGSPFRALVCVGRCKTESHYTVFAHCPFPCVRLSKRTVCDRQWHRRNLKQRPVDPESPLCSKFGLRGSTRWPIQRCDWPDSTRRHDGFRDLRSEDKVWRPVARRAAIFRRTALQPRRARARRVVTSIPERKILQRVAESNGLEE